MAKMRGRIPKESSGGYARVFGNQELGKLLSTVQGTVISAGSELERLIKEQNPILLFSRGDQVTNIVILSN